MRNIKRFCLIAMLATLTSCEFNRSRYDKAFEVVLGHEGGYVNHPNDPGGETKYGICKKYNPDVDIKNITLDFAKQYYKDHYWKSLFDRVKNQDIAIKLFDISVNLGYSRLEELIKSTLMDAYCYPNKNLVSQLISVSEADKLMPESKLFEDFAVRAINKVDSDLFMNIFRAKLVDYYCSRMYANEKLTVFRRGWIKRAAK